MIRLAAVGLSLVFIAASVAKLVDPGGTTESFRGLGIPAARMAARVVPAFELVLAVVLVWQPLVGAAAALATLAFFTVLLVDRLRHGVSVSCRCFGGFSHQPLSWREPVRNLVLILIAATITIAG